MTRSGTDWQTPLGEAYRLALAYLNGLPDRPVGCEGGPADLRAALGGPLPEAPTPPAEVVTALAAAAAPGLVATGSGRFFGFVIGGATPAALAADWLATTWDQNAGLYATSPAAAAVEEIAGGWLTDLLGLPAHASFGFVTGAQMANLTALAAARHEVLRRAGWNVETRGLTGAPPVRVFAGAGRHDTIDRALRFLGLGTDAIVVVAADDQGRMRADALRTALAAHSGPAIVCAQAGNVNSGAVDPLAEVVDLAHAAGAWVHVDGAFGLWGMASAALRPLLAGVERADSWATDAHKWLNVPYDSGLVFCAHPAAHRAAMGVRAAYLIHSDTGDGTGDRDPLDYNPEFSRRARGFAVYAALRSLGRPGVADLVDRCCALARRFADRLGAAPGVTVLNDVVLNQVLVGFDGPDGHTRAVLDAVRRDGTCFVSGTTWRGRAAMRVSVSNWTTTEDDVDAAVRAVLRIAGGPRPAG
jgi:glutamate/tyrosine decarboxylase-like PLP-dependent enzyme